MSTTTYGIQRAFNIEITGGRTQFGKGWPVATWKKYVRCSSICNMCQSLASVQNVARPRVGRAVDRLENGMVPSFSRYSCRMVHLLSSSPFLRGRVTPLLHIYLLHNQSLSRGRFFYSCHTVYCLEPILQFSDPA